MVAAGNEDWDLQLERYRSYLRLLAQMQIDSRLRHGIDASDVAQQTLLEAHAKRHQFQGNDAELAGWLRQALVNNIRDAARKLRRQKRDINRLRSLDAAVAGSSQKLSEWLAANRSSPSARAIRNEELLRLADALLELPDAQRDAIVLHHLQGCTIGAVAERLQRTDAAVAGLLHRGLKKLKALMEDGN